MVPRAAAEPAVEFDWATVTARHVGTLVHRELQRIARDGTVPKTADARVRERWQHELAELGVPSDLRLAAVERVATAVERALLHDDLLRLLDVYEREDERVQAGVAQEFAFRR